MEITNLIDSTYRTEIVSNLNELSGLIPTFPEKDNDPIYTPLPPRSWDVEITAKSQVWERH